MSIEQLTYKPMKKIETITEKKKRLSTKANTEKVCRACILEVLNQELGITELKIKIIQKYDQLINENLGIIK